jgi:hypothetical protein
LVETPHFPTQIFEIQIIVLYSQVPNPDYQAFFWKTTTDVTTKIIICSPFLTNHNLRSFNFFVRNIPKTRNQIFVANTEIIEQLSEKQSPKPCMQWAQFNRAPLIFDSAPNGVFITICDKKSSVPQFKHTNAANYANIGKNFLLGT